MQLGSSWLRIGRHCAASSLISIYHWSRTVGTRRITRLESVVLTSTWLAAPEWLSRTCNSAVALDWFKMAPTWSKSDRYQPYTYAPVIGWTCKETRLASYNWHPSSRGAPCCIDMLMKLVAIVLRVALPTAFQCGVFKHHVCINKNIDWLNHSECAN